MARRPDGPIARLGFKGLEDGWPQLLAGLVLVPAGVSGLFAGLTAHLGGQPAPADAWQWWLGLVATIIGFTALASWRRLTLGDHNVHPDEISPLAGDEYARFTVLLATCGLNPRGPLVWPLSNFPGIKAVVALVSDVDHLAAVTTMVAATTSCRTSPDPTILPVLIDGGRVPQARLMLDHMRAALATDGIDLEDAISAGIVIADVTGGTTPMSLALWNACQIADVPVLYSVGPVPRDRSIGDPEFAAFVKQARDDGLVHFSVLRERGGFSDASAH